VQQRVDQLALSIDLWQSLHYVPFLVDLDIDDR
jgi:hypothetical protein